MKDTKYQNQAKSMYEQKNIVMLDQVVLGWDLKIGSILEAPGKIIKITGEVAPHAHASVEVEVNGVSGQTTIQTISKLILTGKAVVK